MKIKIGKTYIYISKCRMKPRSQFDDLRRNKRDKLNRKKIMIYEKKGGCCELCGSHFPLSELQIHHIRPVNLYPELISKESNLRLLCAECHVKVHKISAEIADDMIFNNVKGLSNNKII